MSPPLPSLPLPPSLPPSLPPCCSGDQAGAARLPVSSGGLCPSPQLQWLLRCHMTCSHCWTRTGVGTLLVCVCVCGWLVHMYSHSLVTGVSWRCYSDQTGVSVVLPFSCHECFTLGMGTCFGHGTCPGTSQMHRRVFRASPKLAGFTASLACSLATCELHQTRQLEVLHRDAQVLCHTTMDTTGVCVWEIWKWLQVCSLQLGCHTLQLGNDLSAGLPLHIQGHLLPISCNTWGDPSQHLHARGSFSTTMPHTHTH